MREFFKLLVSSKEISDDAKVDIMHTMLNAIVCELYPIEENGLYLRVTDTEDPEKIDVTLWYNHKDEDGNRSVREITKDKAEILKVLNDKYLEKQNNDVKKL